MKQYVVRTLGCKANLYDSQMLEHELQQKGWQPFTGNSDPSPEAGQDSVELCIVNSCTVTHEADKQSRKLAAKLSREFPQASVVMTGCAAEVDPESFLKSPGIHFVVGNQNKDQFVDLISSHILKRDPTLPASPTTILGTVRNYTEVLSQHPTERDWPAASDTFFNPKLNPLNQTRTTRAFLKIQEGCNSFCTYCIIPYGRGPSRNLEASAVVQQVRQLVEAGVREVVITGTNIGDYEGDTGRSLGDLVAQILEETSLERLRLSSLAPPEITPQMLSLMRQTSRFCPHFHVSLQSPHSRVLRLMKRRYTFEQVQECLLQLAEIQTPFPGGVFVGMDLIAGFPGETDSEFEWTYEQLSQLPWTRLHVFPYSERSGTPATRLPASVNPSVRRQRAQKLMKLSTDRLLEHYKKVLHRENQTPLTGILTERGPKRGGQDDWLVGYTPNYLRVMMKRESENEALSPNQIIAVQPFDLTVDPQGGEVAFLARPSGVPKTELVDII